MDSLNPSFFRSAKLTAKRSTAFLFAVFLLFLYLVSRLFALQFFGYDYYQGKVMDQITVSSSLSAKRGRIYDSEGNILADNKTVYRIWISPKNIRTREKETGLDYSSLIAEGLSSLLSLSYETVYRKTQKTSYLDETVKTKTDEETKERVLAFILEHRLETMVFTEATSTRYYPFGSLASHVIGFTGSDNDGLFGLELYYNDDLSGTDGKYLSAADAHGDLSEYNYSTYVKAEDGLHAVTTLDLFIQRELEAVLYEIVETFDVKNRATGIVMNVKTGAILGMATAPTFNLNDPYRLDESSSLLLASKGYAEGSEEYKKEKNLLLYEMWKNKAVTELYEPGSTFKIMTGAMAFDSGATGEKDASFFCGGSYSPVKGVRISCWRKIGHGRGFIFAHGLQQSCNCAMMQVISRVGSERFFDYFTAFGLREVSGVDLPGEAKPLFHEKDALGTVELATSSFGQRFKVTPLQELTAIAAVANGGYLVTPHLLDSLVDSEGNTVFRYETKVKRQAVSTIAADTVSAILEEGVSGTGASRNAYAPGYRIAAKTGTSEKLDKVDSQGGYSLRIGSCAGFAPYDNTEIAVIIVVDEPTTAHYGATVAAPYISRLMGKILPYLGHEPVYREEEKATLEITVPDCTGMSVEEAEATLKKAGFSLGESDPDPSAIVTSQMPRGGEVLNRGYGRVLLYTERETASESAVVPKLTGMKVEEAVKALLDAGLNIRTSGTSTHPSLDPSATAVYQSSPPGTVLPKGSSVTVRFLYDDRE